MNDLFLMDKCEVKKILNNQDGRKDFDNYVGKLRLD